MAALGTSAMVAAPAGLDAGLGSDFVNDNPYPEITNDPPEFLDNGNDVHPNSLQIKNEAPEDEPDQNYDNMGDQNQDDDYYQQQLDLNKQEHHQEDIADSPQNVSGDPIGDEQADPNVSDEPDFQQRLEQLQGNTSQNLTLYIQNNLVMKLNLKTQISIQVWSPAQVWKNGQLVILKML